MNTKLTNDEVTFIWNNKPVENSMTFKGRKAFYTDGPGPNALARMFNVSPTLVQHIWNGLVHSKITGKKFIHSGRTAGRPKTLNPNN